MSAKKSWDVQRKASPAAARPVQSSIRVPTAPAKGKREPLKNKRRKERRTARVVLVLFVIGVCSLLLYLVWRPALRVSDVSATGPQIERIRAESKALLEGTYAYSIPRNSIFFFPEDTIRKSILKNYPDVVAVSISRTSFHSIEVRAVPRASSFIWCGARRDELLQTGCFNADAEGLIFKNVNEGEQTESAQASSTLRVYASLNQEILEGQSPVGAHVVHPEAVPKALQFIKALKQLGVPVEALTIRGDEADVWIGRTRITYVLGHEEEAAGLAASTLPQLSLRDNTIEYVDLRFVTKAYIKKFELAK